MLYLELVSLQIEHYILRVFGTLFIRSSMNDSNRQNNEDTINLDIQLVIEETRNVECKECMTPKAGA